MVSKPILYDQHGVQIRVTPGAAHAAKVLGTPGLKNLGGRIQEEYDTGLKPWEKAVRVYLEMKDDVTVATLLDAIKLPLLSADFDVEPFSDLPADIAAKDFLWDNMMTMNRQSWRSHVADALESIDFGWSIGEMVMEKRADGHIYLRNIDPRGQETLHRWEFNDESKDDTVGFWQRDPDTGKIVLIPIEKTVHMTFRGRKGNPQGKALLRDLWRTWRFTKDLENFEGIGLERSVGGMPVATLPDEPLDEADLTALQNSLRNLRMDEEMYLIVPDGLDVSPYSASMNTGPLNIVIVRKQKEILMRGFAQFITLGMNNVGTQALVKGSQDFFTLGLEAIQQEFLETWNQQLVPYLFRFNRFPGMTGLPRINWDTPGKVDVESMLTAYNTAKTAMVITPTREDEEHWRAIMDLPDLPEGVGEGPRNIPEPASRFSEPLVLPSKPKKPPWFGFTEDDPNLRSGGGDFEDSTNRTQQRLVNIYDAWAVETRNLIVDAQDRGIGQQGFTAIVNGRLSELETSLVSAQQEGINAAIGLAVTARLLSTPSVRNVVLAMTATAAQGLRTGLIDSIRDRLTSKLQDASELSGDSVAFDRSGLKGIFDTARASVASSAGVAWNGLFVALLAAGREQESQTGRTQRVRWNLNDAAEHCVGGGGKFGCPDLAGIYDSWQELPTVPAGETQCRGNCRCVLEAETSPGSNVWERGIPEFVP